MKFIDILKISFENLFRQKLRTILTLFSIVIGATLVSLVYSIIPGFKNFLIYQLQTFSTPEAIEIYATKRRPGRQIFGSIGSGIEEYQDGDTSSVSFDFKTFKNDDIENIKKIEGVKNVHETTIPSVEYINLEGSDKKFKLLFVMYYPDFMQKNLKLVSGRKISVNDNGKIVITKDYAEAFGYKNTEEIIGKKVYLNIKQQPKNQDLSSIYNFPIENLHEKLFEFEIVGVLEKTILSSMAFVSYEDAIKMTKFYRNTDDVLTDNDNNRFVAWIELQDLNFTDSVLKNIEEFGFSGMTYEQSKNILDNLFGVLTIAFSSFGVLAMAVSSLGILNTLIMAVYERTREVGVMKALGATKKDIALLFTFEAAYIGLIGGLIGLAIGFGLSEILNIIGHKTIFKSFVTLDISNISFLLCLGPLISFFVATISGIYPSIRAANLDPVKALRFE